MASTRELKDATEVASTTAFGVAKLAASGGTTGGTVVQATDSRLSDARTPTGHHASHETGGSDVIPAASISGFDTQVRTNRLDQLAAPTADVSANGHKITNLAAPASANDAARKADVDAAVAGLSWKQAVRAATTAAGTLASSFENGDAIDGVTLATGDRILVKNQAAPAENGIYVVAASGAPTRATDADSAGEVLQASVYVQEGTANADTQWVGTANAPITLGTTALPFGQLASGGTTYSAGSGLALSGSTFALDINGLSAIGTVDPAADYLALYDASGAVLGKAKPNDLGIGGGGGTLPGIQVVASQTVNNNATSAAFPFSTENWKDSGFTHSNVTNNSRIVSDNAARLLVQVRVRTTVSTGGNFSGWHSITYKINGGSAAVVEQHDVSTFDALWFSFSFQVGVSAGDYFEFFLFQNTGANRSYEFVVTITGVA
jgi:hypothetical protein